MRERTSAVGAGSGLDNPLVEWLLAEGWYSAGVHKLEFDASNQPSGLYFYRFTYDGGSDTKKMILLK